MFRGVVMSKEPIMVFTAETLNKSLKWWKKKLFLTDWTIRAKLVPPDELGSLLGNNTFTFEDKSSIIRIADIPISERSTYVGKLCDECTLVHELLHLKYNLFEDSSSFEKSYVENMEHQKLEQLAKTLIMTKYNLPFKWFDNQV